MSAELEHSEHDEPDFVEVARARDRFEATIWTRNLEDQGISATVERAPGLWPHALLWLRSLLYLGRVPYSVRVPRKDQPRALEYLKKFRFI